MAIAVESIADRDITNFLTTLNAWFTANDTVYIRHFQYIAGDLIGSQGLEHSAHILYETGGAQMAAPFSASLYHAANVPALETLLQAAVSAADDEFWQGPFVNYIQQTRRVDKYYGLLVNTSDLANGQTNWAWS